MHKYPEYLVRKSLLVVGTEGVSFLDNVVVLGVVAPIDDGPIAKAYWLKA